MKTQKLLVLLACLAGCSSLQNTDIGTVVSAGADLAKAATLSDDDVKAMAMQFRNAADAKYKVAPAGSKYAARLAKITSGMTHESGLSLDYKAYVTNEVNAFALANGSVRVYSGLMDRMNDDELRFVIGHEIGHVANGHSKAGMRTTYATSAARKGVASQGGAAGTIAASAVGGMLEKVINAQYSQSQESEADQFGLQVMQRHKYEQRAAVTALKKLASLGDSASIFSSHPAPSERAARLEKLIR